MTRPVPPHIPIAHLEEVSAEDEARLQRRLDRQKRTQRRRTDNSLLDAALASMPAPAPRLETHKISPGNVQGDDAQQVSSEDRKLLAEGLRILSLPKALKAKRTHFVNAQSSVIAARAAVDVLLVNTYMDTNKIRKRIEKRMIESNQDCAELAGKIARNPGILDKNWMGKGKSTHFIDRPDPHELAKRLDILAGVLLEARAIAANAFPLAQTLTQNLTPRSFK